MQDLMSSIRDVFRSVFEDETIEVTESTTAADIPGWDSLMHVTLTVNVERAFGVRFTSAEVAQLKNVGELAGLVRQRLTRKKAA